MVLTHRVQIAEVRICKGVNNLFWSTGWDGGGVQSVTALASGEWSQLCIFEHSMGHHQV